MRLITISREYRAGGREVAGKLSRALGWDLLDHELLHRAAQLEHLPYAELEAVDEQAISLTDRFRLHPSHQRYIHGLTEAARQAAAQGNVILVGRGTRELVGETPDAFHLWLVALRDWRVRRLAASEGLSSEQAEARCRKLDQTRERFTRFFFGSAATQPWQYDLIVNTGRVPIDQVVDLVVALVRNGSVSSAAAGTTGGRILTLAASWGLARPGSRRRWQTGWAYAVTIARCSNMRPSDSACSRSRRSRWMRIPPASSSASGPAASTTATLRSWGSS